MIQFCDIFNFNLIHNLIYLASSNLCFSIPLSGGNLSLVSFDSTLRIFRSKVMPSFVICIFIFVTKTLLLAYSTLGTMQSSSTTSHSFINTSCPSLSNPKNHPSSSSFLNHSLPFLISAIFSSNVILLINQPLVCYIKHSDFIQYDMHSLPVSISAIVIFVVVLHYYSAIFLRPYSSRCLPASSILMTTGPILLSNGTPAGRETFP